MFLWPFVMQVVLKAETCNSTAFVSVSLPNPPPPVVIATVSTPSKAAAREDKTASACSADACGLGAKTVARGSLVARGAGGLQLRSILD